MTQARQFGGIGALIPVAVFLVLAATGKPVFAAISAGGYQQSDVNTASGANTFTIACNSGDYVVAAAETSDSAVTGATIGGNAMTQVDYMHLAGGTFSYGYLFTGVCPSSSPTVAIEATGENSYFYAQARWYTGAASIEGEGQDLTYGTSLSVNVTTTNAGDWLAGFVLAADTGNSYTAGSGFTSQGDGNWVFGQDTAGGSVSVGSNVVDGSVSGSETVGMFGFALVPSSGVGGSNVVEATSSPDQIQQDWLGAFMLYFASMVFGVWLIRTR